MNLREKLTARMDEIQRIMEANDIAIAVWSAIQISPSAVVEEIILTPQLGDL